MNRLYKVRNFITRTRAGSALLGLFMLVLAVLGIFMVRPFTQFLLRIGYTCMIHKFTGLNCSACGTTRAVYAALNGKWLKALSLNPLFFAAAALYLAFAVYLLFNAVRRTPRQLSMKLSSWQLWSTRITVPSVIM